MHETSLNNPRTARLPWSEEAVSAFIEAEQSPLCPAIPTNSLLGRAEIESVLPHRAPFLLLDKVSHLDFASVRVCAHMAVSSSDPILAGHFPGNPIYPGVLQIEAIGQSGNLLHTLQRHHSYGLTGTVILTHVLGSRFMRPVRPAVELDILATVIDDGSLVTTVGQIMQFGRICSVAALSGIIGD